MGTSRKNSEERGDLPSGTASSRTGTGSACSRRGLQGERLGEARYTSPHHTQGGGGKGQGSPRDSRLEDRSPTAFKVSTGAGALLMRRAIEVTAPHFLLHDGRGVRKPNGPTLLNRRLLAAAGCMASDRVPFSTIGRA